MWADLHSLLFCAYGHSLLKKLQHILVTRTVNIVWPLIVAAIHHSPIVVSLSCIRPRQASFRLIQCRTKSRAVIVAFAETELSLARGIYRSCFPRRRRLRSCSTKRHQQLHIRHVRDRSVLVTEQRHSFSLQDESAAGSAACHLQPS